MRKKTVKAEKHRMWFSDLGGTERMLAEHSREGWHLVEMDADDCKFTFRKGEPKNYDYRFILNGESYNFIVFTPVYETLFEAGGLSLRRREEDDDAAYETVSRQFHGDVQAERAWLEEMAGNGMFLYHVDKPEYTFTMGEGCPLHYRIEPSRSPRGYAAYLEQAQQSGWEYVWGDGHAHYLVSEAAQPPAQPDIPARGAAAPKPFGSILVIGLAGLLGAAGKFVYDVMQYAGGVQQGAGGALMDLAAAAVCAGALVFVIIKRRKRK